jgi:HSP20 family protein
MVQIPWLALSGLKEEAERVIGDALSRVGPCKLPLWDLIERPEEFLLLAELPGVVPESLDVRLAGSTLTIKGEKRQEPPGPEETYHVAERSYGPFSRSLTLPAAVDASGVRADYRQGILRVRLPKSGVAEARKIKVESL